MNDFNQYILVGLIAFLASVLGGCAGYGTGLLLPPALVPIIGAEAVVPVISLSALLTNASRLLAFWSDFDHWKAGLVILSAVPSCLLAAYGYTLLSGPAVTTLIGVMLILLVPLRVNLIQKRGHLPLRSLPTAAAGYGLLAGGTSGSGVILISILLSAGLSGSAVIATDAAISLVLGIAKVILFQTAGALPFPLWAMSLTIGVCSIPGAFLAKRLTSRLPEKKHSLILDGMVFLGGILLLVQGVRAFWNA